MREYVPIKLSELETPDTTRKEKKQAKQAEKNLRDTRRNKAFSLPPINATARSGSRRGSALLGKFRRAGWAVFFVVLLQGRFKRFIRLREQETKKKQMKCIL